MPNIAETIERSKKEKPQQYLELSRGVKIKRTARGIPVVQVHYSADPRRDPDIHPEWKEAERSTYPSQGAWDREQEVVDEAGGGELVFADTLISHWKKIVITDPLWRPEPNWRVEAGFDHGKTNPTALERAYIDYASCVYMCGEYYMPGKEIWQHAQIIKQMADVRKIRHCYADPSIFPDTNQQSNKEAAKSYNDIYVENGIALFSQYYGDRNDLSFASRILSQHWANLGPSDRELALMTDIKRAEVMAQFREPTLKIVCREYRDKPQYGLHDWDSPNLLWEMMRSRRRKLSATQLMQRNPTEEIIDKDNHAEDATKYLILTLPEPAQKTQHELAMEAIAHIPLEDVTSRAARYEEAMYTQQRNDEPVPMSKMAKRRMAQRRR
jgi:hypothetical protein